MQLIAILFIAFGALGQSAPEETLKTAIIQHDLSRLTSTLEAHPSLLEWKYADFGNSTPLLLAACAAFEDGVEYLLLSQASINAKTKEGFGLVHMAVCMPTNGKKILEIMKAHGLALSAVDNLGNNVAHIAAARDNAEAIDFLVANGFDLYLTNSFHDLPIHSVALSSTGAVIPNLLKAGVPIDIATSHDGKSSALQMTCNYASSPRVVRVLLNNGANPNFRDNRGESPLHNLVRRYFEENHHGEILEMLLSSGADPNLMSVSCDTPMSLIFNRRQFFPNLWSGLRAAKGKIGGVGPDLKCALFDPP